MRFVIVLLLIFALSGCGAAVEMKDGTTRHGEILRATESELILKEGGEEVSLARAEVEDIRHPKSVMVVGGLLMGVGGLGLAAGASSDSLDGAIGFVFGGMSFLLGAGVLGAGYWLYDSSVDAATPPEGSVEPTVWWGQPGDSEFEGGLGVKLRF